MTVNEEDVKIKSTSATMDDSGLIMGVVIDKARVSQEMPRSITNARLHLFRKNLRSKDRGQIKIRISSTEQ